MAEADPRKIEMLTGRKYPFGNQLKEALTSLPPKVNLRIETEEDKRIGKSKLIISLTRVSESTSRKRHYADLVRVFDFWSTLRSPNQDTADHRL